MTHDCHTIAYHEAGHAVIASVLGLPVEYATIRARETSGGHVRLSPNTVSDNYIMMLHAGRTAQAGYNGSIEGDGSDMVHMYGALYYLNTGTDPYLRNDAETTEDAIKRLLVFLGTDLAIKQMSEHALKTESLVRAHWAAIEAVAMGLIAQETLSADDIQRMIAHPDKAPRNPYGWGLCKECRSAWHKRTKRPGYEDMIQLSLW